MSPPTARDRSMAGGSRAGRSGGVATASTATASRRAGAAVAAARVDRRVPTGLQKFHSFHTSVTDTAHLRRYRLGRGRVDPPVGWGADRVAWRSIEAVLVRRTVETAKEGQTCAI